MRTTRKPRSASKTMTESSSSGRRRTGSYARGEEARTRIIETAIESFGRDGFAQTSTRSIAAAAGVNLGALQYYFGGKQELYLACATLIADRVEPRLTALSAMMEASRMTGAQTQGQLVGRLRDFLDRAIDQLLMPGPSKGWLMFVNREQMFPGPAYRILHDRVVSRLLAMVASLIGPIVGEKSGSDAAIIRTIAFLGPIFIYQRAPAIALETLGWPDLGEGRLKLIKPILIRQMIDGLAADAPIA